MAEAPQKILLVWYEATSSYVINIHYILKSKSRDKNRKKNGTYSASYRVRTQHKAILLRRPRTNRDTCAAVAKITCCLYWHTSNGIPQMLSNKPNLAKQVKTEGERPSEAKFKRQI